MPTSAFPGPDPDRRDPAGPDIDAERKAYADEASADENERVAAYPDAPVRSLLADEGDAVEPDEPA